MDYLVLCAIEEHTKLITNPSALLNKAPHLRIPDSDFYNQKYDQFPINPIFYPVHCTVNSEKKFENLPFFNCYQMPANGFNGIKIKLKVPKANQIKIKIPQSTSITINQNPKIIIRKTKNDKIIKPRRTLDVVQKHKLRTFYQDNKNPSLSQIIQLSIELNLKSNQVKKWFINRRYHDPEFPKKIKY